MYCRFADAQCIGGFLKVHVLIIVENQRVFEVVGQAQDVQHQFPILWQHGHHALRQVFQRVPHVDVPKPPFPLIIAADIDGNAHQPRFDARAVALLEGVHCAPSAEEGVLHGILSFTRVGKDDEACAQDGGAVGAHPVFQAAFIGGLLLHALPSFHFQGDFNGLDA